MSEARRIERVGLPVGLGLGAAVIGLGAVAAEFFLVDRRQALFSYMAAFGWGASLALGALTLVMIGRMTGASWFVAIRRPMEALAATLPLFALLFLPIALEVKTIYPWALGVARDPHAAKLLERKKEWLQPAFFEGRAAFYLVAWSVLAGLLWRWTTRSLGASRDRERVLSYVGFPILALTTSFAAFDWFMSTEPEWYSALYGAYFWTGGFVAALSVHVLATLVFKRRGLLPHDVGPSHYHALGKLLLTGVIFWAYLAYSQGFIIWIGDEPGDALYYVERTRDGWGAVFAVLFVGHFALPFAALLSRELKRTPAALALVAGWLVAFHYMDIYWLVIPAARERFAPSWFDLAALVGVAGALVATTTALLGGHAALPLADPQLEESLRFETT